MHAESMCSKPVTSINTYCFGVICSKVDVRVGKAVKPATPRIFTVTAFAEPLTMIESMRSMFEDRFRI